MTLPIDQDEELSSIVLSSGSVTLVSPGTVTLSGHDSKINWNDQQAPGQQGLITVRKPDPIVEFTASFLLMSDRVDDDGRDDFDRWEEFQRLIDSTTAGPKPFALAIIHPDLARQRITDVIKGTVGGMVHDGRGGARVSVVFRGFRPPKPATTSSVRQGTTTLDSADPLAARKAERDALLTEAQKP
jgi:hypothetical protein